MWLLLLLLLPLATLVFAVSGAYASCPDSCQCVAPVIECSGRMPRLQELDRVSGDFVELVVSQVEQKQIRPYVGSTPNSTFLRRLQSLQLTNCSSLSDLHYLYWDVLVSNSGNFPVLPNVKVLNVSSNQLTDLQGYRRVDQRVSNHLSVLDASRNRISTISLMDFRHTPRLIWLSLADNKLDYIGSNNFKPLEALEYLDLSNNVLHNLEGIFDSLKSLQRLNVAGNKLEHVQASWLQNLSKLVELDISRNKLTFVPADTLQPLMALSVFKLAENPLIERDLSLLLGTGRRLESVDASRIGLVRVPAALTHSVRTLRLTGNQLTSINCGDLDSYPLLKMLDIADNRLVVVEDDALGRLDSLKELDLSGNIMPSIPKSLPSGLEILDLKQNAISKLRSNDFQGLNQLRILDLSGNVIEIIEQESFRQLPALETLDVSDNPIKKLPSDALSGSSNLVTLRMSGLMSLRPEQNQNQDTAFPIVNLERLVTLDVARSPVLAAQLLADNAALPACKSLQKLNLSYTNIRAIRSDLAYVLPQLNTLNLIGNKWNCSDDQFWLGEWLRQHAESSIRYSTKCVVPPGLEGKPLEKMPRPLNFINSTKERSQETVQPIAATRNSTKVVDRKSIETNTAKYSKEKLEPSPTVVASEKSQNSSATNDVVEKSPGAAEKQWVRGSTQPPPLSSSESQVRESLNQQKVNNESLDVSSISRYDESATKAANEEKSTNPSTTGGGSSSSSSYDKRTASKIASYDLDKFSTQRATSIELSRNNNNNENDKKTNESISTMPSVSNETASTVLQKKSASILGTTPVTSTTTTTKITTSTTTLNTSSFVTPTRKSASYPSKKPPTRVKEEDSKKADDRLSNKLASAKKESSMNEENLKNLVISEFSHSKLLRANEEPRAAAVDNPVDAIDETNGQVTQSGARVSETIAAGTHPGMLLALLGAAVGACASLVIILSRRKSVKRRDRQYQRHENIEVHTLTPITELW